MSKEETNIFKGIAIILMFVHHLFMDNDVLDMMNVHSILPRDALLLVASTSKICVAIFVELGINSFYMFLTHSFIHYYYLRDFIYSWKYASLIFSALLIYSYILSKCISFVYKKIKIENIETYLLKKIVDMERIKRCFDKYI